MAQNSEPFHVPQQNRRNKLRVTTQTSHQEQQNPLSAPTFSHQNALMNPSLSPPFSSFQTLKDLTYHPVTSQGLSLSLSVQLERQRYINAFSGSGDFLKPNCEMRSSVPFGPFTGYASILKSSRFLKPAQQILDDLCGVNCGILDFPFDCLSESEVMRESNTAFIDRSEHQWKNSKLMLMLDEVYRRYKLYCQQMQSVIASFENVAGLGNAAPYISYAIKIVSKQFSCLKNALLDQIQFTGKKIYGGNVTKETNSRVLATEQGLPINQNQTLNLSFIHNPVWRSQRGLPDHAVAVLKTWLFEHFLHPYPTDSEKQTLARQTGLSRTQVSNWFINARVRLWKPMVEEVHMLESQQAHQLPAEGVNQNAKISSDFPLEKLPAATQHQNAGHIPTKRSRNELLDVFEKRQEQRNVSVSNLLNNYQTAGVNGGNGVSLALGLHQCNGIDLSWPFPMNIAQHVNLEMIGMMDSASATRFKAQNQHLG